MKNTQKSKAPVLSLVPSAVNIDAVRAVQGIEQEVAAGRVVGIAWIELHGGTDFSVHIAGSALALPCFTRGALAELDFQLAKIVGAR